MITFTISTYNNLDYLRWAVKSVRENAYYKNAPFIIHAENCTDGTNEWLEKVKGTYNLEVYIEPKVEPARGIGGGMNFCASKVQTDLIIFLQSDFYVAENFDLELLKEYDKHTGKKLISSWRIQPNIFNNPPMRPGNIFMPLDQYGAYHGDFRAKDFLDFAKEFSNLNDIQIRRGEGAGGYLISKEDWNYIGGNDSRFAPTSWEDMDLFIRMQNENFTFIETTKSVIWHFAGRGSHRLEENNGQSSERQVRAEQRNATKFYDKWGQLPTFDRYDFVEPIVHPTVNSRMNYNVEHNLSLYI